MAFDYFDALSLNDEERNLFRSFGAVDAETVLGQMYAAPAEFERLLGPDRFPQLRSGLQQITGNMPDLTKSLPSLAMGSLLTEAPALHAVNEELLRHRDRVYAQIQELQGKDQISGDESAELESLRSELHTIFDELNQ